MLFSDLLTRLAIAGPEDAIDPFGHALERPLPRPRALTRPLAPHRTPALPETAPDGHDWSELPDLSEPHAAK